MYVFDTLLQTLASQAVTIPGPDVSWQTQLSQLGVGIAVLAAGSILGIVFWIARHAIDSIQNATARRLISRINEQAEIVASAAFDQFKTLEKAARSPASAGGIQITDDEWKDIKKALWVNFQAGFGQSWVERGMQILGSFAFQETAQSALVGSLAAKLDEKRALNASYSISA